MAREHRCDYDAGITLRESRMKNLAITSLIVICAGAAGCRKSAPAATPKGVAIERVIMAFADAGARGDFEAAQEFTVEGKVPPGQAADLFEFLGGKPLELSEVLGAEEAALAIGAEVTSPGGDTGSLVFTMVREGKGDWKIEDIDLEDRDGIEEEKKRFRERFPRAESLMGPIARVEVEANRWDVM